jgi:multidrug resistance efflux pump
MITRLRERTRADRFLNDVRSNQKKRRNYGRYFYLAAVAGVFLYLLNLVFGHYFWLQAEGLIVSDHVIVASPYEVQVVRMVAQPGTRVRAGDVLAEVHSPQVTDTLATLSAQSAETMARKAEIAIRLEVADAIMEAAEERLAEAEERAQKVTESRGRTGFVSDAFIATVTAEHYTARQERAVRAAERRASIEQLANLERSTAEAQANLADLRRSYNDGIVLAPVDGIIGPHVAVQGDVLQPGTHLMQLYIGEKYAYVYLDTGTLHRASVGDRVWVADGFNATKGSVKEILPLTVQLPVDFQRAFRPPSRGQVARIALDDATPFPLSSKISIRGDKLIPGNDFLTRTRLQEYAGGVMTSLRGGIGTLIMSRRNASAATTSEHATRLAPDDQ